ncbi:hypothetical protein MHU86_10104 [Fragilaria crotonensis]|nr:hypothetical protein MHU86_10104 [Fragilaria crotonensis]
MSLIRPTDIMLGRGPKCYNNSGNRVLRKLIKEHVVHYTSTARRREKAALVKLLVSTLQMKGYRFLHLSPTGTWIEAPLHIAEKKVGHGLRDARLSVARNAGNDNVLPKNFRPSYKEQIHKDQVTPVLSWEANNDNEEEMQSNESDAKQSDTTDSDPQRCDASPTTLQKCANDVVAASSAKAVQRVQGAFQGKEQQLVNTNAGLQEYPSVQEDGENGNFSLVGCGTEEDVDQWVIGGNVIGKTERWPARGSTSSSYAEAVQQRFEHWGHSWENLKNSTCQPYVTPSTGEALDAHHLNAVDMALNMYAPAYGRTFDNLFDDDPYQPIGCAVEDAQSLCHWFSTLS